MVQPMRGLCDMVEHDAPEQETSPMSACPFEMTGATQMSTFRLTGGQRIFISGASVRTEYGAGMW